MPIFSPLRRLLIDYASWMVTSFAATTDAPRNVAAEYRLASEGKYAATFRLSRLHHARRHAAAASGSRRRFWQSLPRLMIPVVTRLLFSPSRALRYV